MTNGMLAGGRAARLQALTRVHFRRPEDFVGIPDTADKRWFIVKTNPQCEARAEEAMRRIGYHPYAPVIRSHHFDKRTNKRVYRLKRVFVGYTFVPMSEVEFDPGLIRECDGVNDFVGKSVLHDREFIASISDREMEALRREEASAWLAHDREFRARRRRFKPSKRGAIIERKIITTGAFEGFLAAIVSMGKAGAKVVTQANGDFVTVSIAAADLAEAA